MKQQFKGWKAVARALREDARIGRAAAADGRVAYLDAGQCATLCGIAERIATNGMLIADEVGMGKTRIATMLARSVVAAGGRVAIVIPPGLGYQWQTELSASALLVPDVIRGLPSYYRAWHPDDRTPASVVPLRPWYDEPVLLISHAFGHWRLREGSERTALLPELFARWRMRANVRAPNGYDAMAYALKEWGGAAAIGIVGAVPDDPAHGARIFLDDLVARHTWNELHNGDAYRTGAKLRRALEGAVGLGFGMFDLVIIDEAHKGRQTDSRLSALLDHVLLRAPHVRKVGLTATPVELEAEQWWNTLARIDVLPAQLGCAINDPADPIKAYADAVQRLGTTWRSSAAARQAYSTASRGFQQALTPYLLRRDKRRDRAVLAYAAHSGQPADRYRNVDQEIVVDPGTLDLPWKRAICAAESLSLLLAGRSGQSGSIAQRLRLTIGNGHGIASLLDQAKNDPRLDDVQMAHDAAAALQPDAAPVEETDKRVQRAAWWQQRIVDAFAGDGDAALFDHPAICAAVARIEEAGKADEKVLVFGRFTRPMQALTSLLNAREMLRRLARGVPWPQAKVHGSRDAGDANSEWPAVRAAWRQLRHDAMTDADEVDLDNQLEQQYRILERHRQRFREQLLGRLDTEFSDPALHAVIPGLERGATILAAFKRMVARAKDGSDQLATVARALSGLLSDQTPDAHDPLPAGVLAQAFLDLIRSAASRDMPDSEEQAETAGQPAHTVWESVMKQLHAEYSGPRGGFARLMNGNTQPETRRLLQLAFNRKGSFPRVLVAQSMVGREGLNLHEACRTVVLLHPEWNPGVVEQQIGRVDRVGSHWSQQLDLAIANGVSGKDLPRIEVYPVVFGGTYDAENWRVLRERWDALRAQLHGVPVPARLAGDDAEAAALIKELTAMAPDFSPQRGGEQE